MGFFSRKKKKQERTVTVAIEPSGTLIDKDGWFYRESQDPNDSPYTIRISQKRPGSNASGPFEGEYIAGLNHPRNQPNTLKFFAGRYRWLELEPEPTNDYDKHAVKVIGKFMDGLNTEQRLQLGYVDRNTAKEMANFKISELCPLMYYIQFPNPEHDTIKFKIGFRICSYSKVWLRKNKP